MHIHTHRRATVLIGAVAALGAIVSVLAYWDSRKHAKTKADLLALDKEIKTLEIAQKHADLGIS